jgi:hypothetical protein
MRDADGGTTPPRDNELRGLYLSGGRPYQGEFLYEAPQSHPRGVGDTKILYVAKMDKEKTSEYNKKYRQEHHQEAIEYGRNYYAKNKDKILEQQRLYREKNKEKIASKFKEYYDKNREKRIRYTKEWEDRNIEHVNAYRINFRKNNREKLRAQSKEYRKTHKQEERNRSIKRFHGLSPEEYESILNSQGGVCAICQKDQWNSKGPNVDHDHLTGNIRGILCNGCNTALGLIKENSDTAIAMAEYIKKHNAA